MLINKLKSKFQKWYNLLLFGTKTKNQIEYVDMEIKQFYKGLYEYLKLLFSNIYV